jgi:hypothetical protein
MFLKSTVFFTVTMCSLVKVCHFGKRLKYWLPRLHSNATQQTLVITLITVRTCFAIWYCVKTYATKMHCTSALISYPWPNQAYRMTREIMIWRTQVICFKKRESRMSTVHHFSPSVCKEELSSKIWPSDTLYLNLSFES